MSTVIRICDENGNKYSGFEISHEDIISQIFKSEFRIGDKFNIGVYDYEIVNICFSYIKGGLPRITLDNKVVNMKLHLWVWCKTKDHRIKENNITEENQISIAADLMIENPNLQ